VIVLKINWALVWLICRTCQNSGKLFGLGLRKKAEKLWTCRGEKSYPATRKDGSESKGTTKQKAPC
jgi:hypothetical protein